MIIRTSKRLLLSLLAALLVVSTVVSCNNPVVEETESAPETDTTSETEATPVETERILEEQIAEQYADVDYEGYTFQILSTAPGGVFYNSLAPDANEIWYETETGEVYSDAIYHRNCLTEELLNIRIQPDFSASEFGAVTGEVHKRVLAGDTDMDAAVASLTYVVSMASQGDLTNLFRVNTMELDKPWYDQNVIRNYGYKGEKLFSVTGSYNVFDDLSAPMIMYGIKILQDHGLQDPAELVREGIWTIDNMMIMAETVTEDLNGDGTMTPGDDAFGILDNTDIMVHFMEGAAQPMTRVDENSVPYINTQTEKYITVAEFIFNRVITNESVVLGLSGVLKPIFGENRGAFYVSLMASLGAFRELEVDFSLLPMPKYNEAEESYVDPINSVWCTSLCIPVSVVDVERSGTIWNVLSAFSMNTVDKVLYEVLLGAKLIRNEETVEMLDYILNNKQYCWGNGYSWSTDISRVLQNQVNNNAFTVASGMESIRSLSENALKSLLEKLDEQP